MWDVWWKKWQWDRFFSEFFGFPLSISFHHHSPYSYIIWGMNNMSISGSSSETSSHPIKNNNTVRQVFSRYPSSGATHLYTFPKTVTPVTITDRSVFHFDNQNITSKVRALAYNIYAPHITF
jgi:hypothetical protein